MVLVVAVVAIGDVILLSVSIVAVFPIYFFCCLVLARPNGILGGSKKKSAFRGFS